MKRKIVKLFLVLSVLCTLCITSCDNGKKNTDFLYYFEQTENDGTNTPITNIPVNGEEKYFIIGIGINVLQENFENLPKAGSILTQTGLQFDLNEFAEQFHFYFSEKILEKKSNEEILEEYNKNLFKKDKISVFEIDGLRQNGIIKSCDEQGFLWIDLENSELQKFYHKEIEMLY